LRPVLPSGSTLKIVPAATVTVDGILDVFQASSVLNINGIVDVNDGATFSINGGTTVNNNNVININCGALFFNGGTLNGNPLNFSLCSHWKGENNNLDEQGLNDGTFIHNIWSSPPVPPDPDLTTPKVAQPQVFASGIDGFAFDFTYDTGGDFNSDVVVVDPVTGFPTNAITTSFWMKTSEDDRGVMFAYRSDSPRSTWVFSLCGPPPMLPNFNCDVDGSIFVSRYDDTPSAGLKTSLSVKDGDWHHVAATWSVDTPDEIKIYIDGVEDTMTSEGGATFPQSALNPIEGGGLIMFGNNLGIPPYPGLNLNYGAETNEDYEGLLDEVKIFNYVLSPAEILAEFNSVNVPPVANTDGITAPKDGSITADVLFNDADPDLDTLTITGVTQGTIGGVTFTANDVTYTPNAGQTGADSFTYDISDGNGGVDTGTVNVIVQGNGQIAFNTARDGNNEIYSMNPDGSGQTDISNNAASDSIGFDRAWSPDGTQILFQSFRTPIGLYTMDADGNNPVPIPNTGGASRPSWSPDGTQIAYSRNVGGNVDIYINSIFGNNEQRVTIHAAIDQTPSWSPDGTQIVFETRRDQVSSSDRDEIYSINVDGTNPQRLTDFNLNSLHPVWSPDGTKIAFSRNSATSNKDIYTMNADGTGIIQLFSLAGSYTTPTWSPDGTKIAFFCGGCGGDISVMNSDGTGIIQLTTDPANDVSPSWGSNTAVLNSAPVANTDGITAPKDGSITADVLFNDSDINGDTLTITAVTQGTIGGVAFTANDVTYTPNAGLTGADSFTYDISDGNGGVDTGTVNVLVRENGKIAFETDRTGNSEIFVMNSDGSNPVNIISNSAGETAPSWSPGGTKIVFVSDRDGNFEIYIMDADGSSQTRLTTEPLKDSSPSFNPDGTKIAFTSERDGNEEIYVMNSDGSSITRLTNDASPDRNPNWSPDGTQITFVSERDVNREIYVMNADGSSQTNISNDPSQDGGPAWSPDGTKITFVSNRDGSNNEIFVMNADGSGPTNLSNSPGLDTFPKWSPDGTQITFVSERDVNREIYVMNADGSGQTNISNDPNFDNTPHWGSNTAPVITCGLNVITTSMNLGTVNPGTPGSDTFDFENTGTGTLVVSADVGLGLGDLGGIHILPIDMDVAGIPMSEFGTPIFITNLLPGDPVTKTLTANTGNLQNLPVSGTQTGVLTLTGSTCS